MWKWGIEKKKKKEELLLYLYKRLPVQVLTKKKPAAYTQEQKKYLRINSIKALKLLFILPFQL